MEPLLTNEQMREADAFTIKTLGVPSLTLMERAGKALADQASLLAPQGRVLCVCGSGNNGGDGFVCARILKERGRETDCLFMGKKETEECRINREKWSAAGGGVHTEFPVGQSYALIVDCLFGTGFHGEFPYGELVEKIKNSGAKVLSCDIPSGVNGDNGRVGKIAVKADRTLCIGEKKVGVYLGEGIDFTGETVRADIGISLPEEEQNYARLIERQDVVGLLPKRKRNTHKGSYGKAAIVAGSKEYGGAAYLATAACLRAGAGYTTLFLPAELLPAFMLRMPEALLKEINAGDRYAFNTEKLQELLGYDSIAFGMGMGVSKDVQKGAVWLLSNYEGRLVLDADALNALANLSQGELTEIFTKKKCDVIVTPHIKEFSRLTGEDVQTLLDKGIKAPAGFAETHGCTVLLKNAVSVITDGRATRVNVRGNAGQAKGGSGDVLSGVIAGLCAGGLSAFDGGCAGAYLCGKAAELAAEKIGEYSMLPSDVIAYLGRAFISLYAQE